MIVSDLPILDIIPRISNYGITYWYENDEYQSYQC